MKAAEQGDASAQFNLGVCYGHGEGVEKDYKEAFKWYLKAAEQGDASAQVNVGAIYCNGRGVEKDYVEAYAWLNISAANGNELGRSNLHDIKKWISSERVAKAQERTKQIKAEISAKQAKVAWLAK